MRNALTESFEGLVRWQEVRCTDCGSAQRGGRCKRPSDHDRAAPHPERADAYDRLVWERGAERIEAFAAALQRRGFVPSRSDHIVCTACGSPPLCPCVGPFDPTERRKRIHEERAHAFALLTPRGPDVPRSTKQ
jgi:DNA-directed RNA polymerase subunit RPC12/RpoP